MANTAALTAAITALAAQVEENKTVEGSATVLISGFSAAVTKAVTDALTADNNADDESIRVATEAIANVTAAAQASAADLGAAITANTPPTP